MCVWTFCAMSSLFAATTDLAVLQNLITLCVLGGFSQDIECCGLINCETLLGSTDVDM